MGHRRLKPACRRAWRQCLAKSSTAASRHNFRRVSGFGCGFQRPDSEAAGRAAWVSVGADALFAHRCARRGAVRSAAASARRPDGRRRTRRPAPGRASAPRRRAERQHRLDRLRLGQGRADPAAHRTGAGAVAAQRMRNAAELAISEFQKPDLTILVKDDRGTPDGAREAAQPRRRGGRGAHRRPALRRLRAGGRAGRAQCRQARHRLLDRRRRRDPRRLSPELPARRRRSTASSTTRSAQGRAPSRR